MDKTYKAQENENQIYEKWEESGFFNPDNLEGEPYSVMMPPPNVTGVLHLGHALENSLMDVMIRYQRMMGKRALLLPGTDHAAVATQAKVEKLLIEKGIKNPREELGREKLLEEIKKFAKNSQSTILSQIKKMGTSCDWSRLAYTFDEKRSRAVNAVFKKMYDDGLIYRGYKVVNWSVRGQSTCSDDELEYIDRKAKLYTFKYSKDFPITIATTRPETKLGDTAVAVNPNDERYKKFIGEVFKVDVGAKKPLSIKIIADENVDPSFGTGALGVTPAHSMVDFEMYEKQKAKNDPIGIIQVIGTDGKMTEEAGENYKGLSVLEARDKFVQWLKNNDLLIKEEEIDQSVGTSDRFKDVVEALPMTQWFVDVNKKIPGKNKSLKDLLREAVLTGHNNDPKQKININPPRFEKVYFNWIDNLRDWCISRQIWWGHRIPVWYKGDEVYVGEEAPGEGWKQDEDTLDTWFSSGLWTFSTLGWPEQTKDLQDFHPSSWMQMGHEILFFWMARMILMSTYVLDEIPFKDVYIHGVLRDGKGKKFSKSSGNNIDPLEVIENYGTDALRLSLLIGVSPGQDSKYYEEKVESARNFVNKVWNIARYIDLTLNKEQSDLEFDFGNLNEENLSLADKWILDKFNNLLDEINIDFSKFRFSQIAEKLQHFTKEDLADWYLEASKFQKEKDTSKVLRFLLENILKAWHPFIPFVTEKIWQNFNKDLLLIQKYPQKENFNFQNTSDFDFIKDIIISIRNARSENKVEPSRKVKAVIVSDKENLIKENEILIKKLRTGVESIVYGKEENFKDAIKISQKGTIIYLLGAIDKEKEAKRIEKETKNLQKLIENLNRKLSNENFVNKAPKEIVNREKERLKDLKEKLSKLQLKK